MKGQRNESANATAQESLVAGKKVVLVGTVEGQTQVAAEGILSDAGAFIGKNVSEHVDLVVLGSRVGKKNLDQIAKLSLDTIKWDELIEGNDDEDEEETSSAGSDQGKAKRKKSTSGSSDFTLTGKTVIITGTIPGHDRKSSQAIVQDAGASIAKSLNKSVDLVILGTNPGPDKMTKISKMGIETLQWDDLASKLSLEITPAKEVADVEVGDAPDSIDGMTVIVSGTVDGHTRQEAQDVLKAYGAKYAKSLNRSVELVVLGANPGPDKLGKIKELGIGTCEFEELIEKLGGRGKKRKKA